MSAATAIREIYAPTSLVFAVEHRRTDPSDRFAQLVVQLVALADGPVDPTLITPAALVLRDEHLIELRDVTFGCNYELDVRSFELDSGYVRAIDSGWLTLRQGEVRVNPHFPSPDRDSDASAEARKLFALGRQELIRVARHHLFRDADDRSGRAA